MYEPVSATFMNPKYTDNNINFDQQQQQHIDNSANNIKIEWIGYNNSSCDVGGATNELIPPEKPPRRNKQHQKQQNQKSTTNEVPETCHNNSTMRSNGNGDNNSIDIDNINFETHHPNNYYNNNKRKTASVQTSQLIPYRLRFWPRSSCCTVKCDPRNNADASCTPIRLKCFCRILTQWCLSQFGLTCIVIVWALLGAYAFHQTEGPRELKQFEDLAQLQDDISVELATSLRQIEKYVEKWPDIIHKYMERHETLLLEAVSAGFGEGGGGSIWTYPGCILFAVSLLTTLGFGAPVPRTSLGRGTAVLFSAIGIPLHFLLILNMGNLVAVKLQRLAYRHGNTNSAVTTEPNNIPTESPLKPHWLTWFPFVIILFYYLMGVCLFGFVRQRTTLDSFMFPLDFTAAGGVATTYGHVRILYALYLEGAVTLAALVVSLFQASATRGFVDLGLRLGLLTNT